MYILTCVLIFLAFFLFKALNHISEKNKILRQFPEPPSVFLFGHCLDIRSTTNMLKAFSKYIEQYGKTVRLSVGPAVVGLLTAEYKFIELLANNNKTQKKSIAYAFLKPWLGLGLLTSNGTKWRQHRKLITPAFHFDILKQFVEIFESVGKILIEKLEEYDGSVSFDLYPLVTLFALDIISESAMGVKINAQKGENSDYVQSVKEMCRIAVDRTLSPIKVYKWTFKLTNDYSTQKKLLPVLHDFTYKVIDEKIRDLESSERIEGKKMAFLDLLLKFSENGKVISYEEIREEVDTFMFEGHDTTSSAICFALFSLANNPNVQDKVYKEQRELFGNEKDPLITYQELQDMKYLELVIKETLRLYPSVPLIGRMTTEDIEFCGSVIPKYTNIFIYIYGLHRDPQFFPDPENFIPERFETFDSSHPYSYIPFSAGQRNCIGQRFAMLELKSAISKVVRHFELMPAIPEHELLLAAESTIKSANGVKVGLKKRI